MSLSSSGASYPPCPDCQSAEVRPSKSSYPLDREKLAAGAGGFWRCRNCGTRFFGPDAAPAAQGRRRHHRNKTDPLRVAIDTQRERKRRLFPLLVLAATVILVILLLLQQNSRPMSLD